MKKRFKEKLSTERKMELEEFIIKDSFLNENNRNIKYFDEISLHFKKLKFSKEELAYLIIASIIPFKDLSIDIECLMNEEYNPHTFLNLMMKKYLYEPKNKKEFESLKKVILYRYESVKEINKYEKNNDKVRVRG